MKLLKFFFSWRFAAIFSALVVLLLLSTRLMSFNLSPDQVAESFQESNFKPAHHYLKNDNGTLHFVTCGDSTKRPLILIHGSPGSWDNFVKLTSDSDLLQVFFILMIDRPGYGASDAAKSPDLAGQSAALAGPIKRYATQQPAVILGHSYGGALSLQLAADYPNCINGIVLAAGTVAASYQEPRWYNYAVKYTPINWLVSDDLQRSNHEMWILSHDLKALYPRLQNLKVNLAVIQGGNDFLVDAKSAGYIIEKMPAAHSKIFYEKDMNHFIIWNDLPAIQDAINWVNYFQ